MNNLRSETKLMQYVIDMDVKLQSCIVQAVN